MAEDKPSIHIDTDWKKQAQEEKRKLAEQEQQKRAAAAPAAGPMPPELGLEGVGAEAAGPRRGAPAGAGAGRETPPASFASLVQSLMTQVLFYLGDLAPRGGEPALNLDMAKHLVDTLNMLEEKTKGNLDEQEKKLLDAALYETRMRYVSVASQFIGP